MDDRSETLFLALTRPALIWGAPVEGVLANIMGTMFAGMILSGPTLWRSPMMFWLIGIPIHGAMRRLISYDFHAFRTGWLWMATTAAGTTNTLESLPTRRPRSGKECPSSV